MNRLIAQAASQYQGKERERFLQLVQQEPMFAAQLRAPLYEDKVVDFLFRQAEITERKATRDQLEADLESEEGHVHGPGCGHDHAPRRPKAKKAAGQEGAGRQGVRSCRRGCSGESQEAGRPSRGSQSPPSRSNAQAGKARGQGRSPPSRRASRPRRAAKATPRPAKPDAEARGQAAPRKAGEEGLSEREIVCERLNAAIDDLRGEGFRLDIIYPADDPAHARSSAMARRPCA